MKSSKDIKTWLMEEREKAIEELDNLLHENPKTEGNLRLSYELTGGIKRLVKAINFVEGE